MHKAEEIKFSAGEKVGKVSGLLILPKGAQALLVLAHGAGAGMRHRFMEETAQKLADQAIATFRYQFALHGKGHQKTGQRSGSHRDCSRGRRRCEETWRWLAAVCRRQIHGRTNDIAGCGEGTIGGCPRLDLFWLPAACRRKTVSGPWRSIFSTSNCRCYSCRDPGMLWPISNF